jgi:ferredoxin
MINLKINNISTQVQEGETLLQAAQRLGVSIPTMCHDENLEHFTSCQVCLVKDQRNGRLFPSCSARAQEGMDILTGDDEVLEARRTALELLLSEHIGDCEAPCRIACPAFMNIPLMNRLLSGKQFDAALQVVMKDIALPGVMGRICPAPCENACKRKPIDQPVSICLLKRAAADESAQKPIFLKKPATGKKVAIVGAGPSGLAAALYLQLKGIQAVIYDRHELPGGALHYDVPEDILNKQVLQSEINHILQQGVIFKPAQNLNPLLFAQLRKDYDAVVLAMGTHDGTLASWGLDCNDKKVMVEKKTYLTNLDKVFAVGNLNLTTRMAIRSAAQGKEVATAIEQLFNGEMVTGEYRRFNSTVGRLYAEEYAEYLKEASSAGRFSPAKEGAGFSPDTVAEEAARCMHCDCRDADDCKLREYSDQHKASRKRFLLSDRKALKKQIQQGLIIYEPGKCIKCGICVRITTKHQKAFGFTYIGRGFDVEIGIPFGKNIGEALKDTAQIVARACPTGALEEL